MTWLVAALLFAYGLAFGSFANVVAYRVPRRESIVRPRSHCVHCHHTLSWWELVPVLSWLVLRGRCRGCGKPISPRYPLLEFVTGVLFASAWWQGHTLAQVFVWALFWLYLMMAVGTDLTAMIVPDVLSLPAAVVLLGASGLTHIQPWTHATIGLATGFAMVLAVHLLSGGRMGLGDAKLYLGIGAMLGPWLTLLSFVLAAILGSVIGIGLRLAGKLQAGQYVPFVPFIALGVMAAAWYGHALVHLYIRLVGL
ncbi:leader peptidase (prepilin peptidase)/N-methyltransferase/leader peptidase (prepilin peptidase)/N-methyltransferase [Alicyclobacillus sacchari]|uniref:Leader peptidase (Prepilin peptidase)/N-methyltransferase/leader peptidase (Prepilin peptidase)/N-methyltransferase n=1 Tax=Alicyclobacillus sacchari TaxID=392010 RepID=A0A4R8LR51_9BACL|nr:A24 family peptidase [Alicyclobacillus sacchari]TDY50050.1 leader peptidase (prepilin peptidase)/N-methyltransferase/leader peptidase (prepilin peptidase)/N-methyltransferase [Alicyclobacillus sacchari]GMA57611.1 type 4 prepilin-like proteins leader peptide-processing enzyme [Alicyclobacillus sacchari]